MFGLIKKVLDKYRDNFEEGGKLEKFYPIFEATDTILFSTNEVTRSGPHIRDSIDTKRIMILVVIALLPLYIFGAINIGFQNSIAIDLERSNWENFWFGFNKILPIINFLLTLFKSKFSANKIEMHANKLLTKLFVEFFVLIILSSFFVRFLFSVSRHIATN